jgi:hypothetical protein
VVLPVALGRAPEGAKRTAGDQRTPEGEYHVAGPSRASRFHRFVPIDYPSEADAGRALAEGRLSRRDHARIVAAHRQGVLPPQDTALGGHLGFHGEGNRWRGESLTLDWTNGCVALADSDLDFILARVRIGTMVTILGPDAALPPFATSQGEGRAHRRPRRFAAHLAASRVPRRSRRALNARQPRFARFLSAIPSRIIVKAPSRTP